MFVCLVATAFSIDRAGSLFEFPLDALAETIPDQDFQEPIDHQKASFTFWDVPYAMLQ